MARVLSTAFLLVLLAATAAAFALAQRARLERVPISSAAATPVFSPDCDCPTSTATVAFRLRSSHRLTVWMERGGARAATIAPGRRFGAGRVELTFDGLTSDGRVLADGVYRPVVRFDGAHRTVRLPTPVRLDSHPPAIQTRRVPHALISPDGDGRRDAFRAPYRLDEAARPLLVVVDPSGRTRVAWRGVASRTGHLRWDGRLRGRPATRGVYVLQASAEDAAGNRANPYPFALVQVRYVALGRPRVLARPGGRFAIRVASDAPSVRWHLRGRSGTARPGTLHLRAPRSRGVFKLYVTANGHAAKAAVIVA